MSVPRPGIIAFPRKCPLACQVRPAIKDDHADILSIDAGAQTPWNPDDLALTLSDGYGQAIVAGRGRYTLGFAIYTFRSDSLDLTRFGVHTAFRRCTIGFQLFVRLRMNLTNARQSMTCTVPDDCLEAHLFLRKLGFRGEMSGTDAYRFTYRLCGTG